MKLLLLLGLACLVQCSSGKPAVPNPPVPNPPPPAPAIKHCSQVSTEGLCDFHIYGQEYCEWETSKCIQIKQCSDIQTRAICDSSPGAFAGCVWLPASAECFKPDPSSCAGITDQQTCNQNLSCSWAGTVCMSLCEATKDPATCSAISWCFWDQPQSECELVSGCNQISAQTKCDNFNANPLFCQWDPSSMCIPITNCTSVLEKSECQQHQFLGQYCQWTGSACAPISTCTDAKTMADCQFIEQPLGCAWDAGASKCVLSPPKVCSDIYDQSSCECFSTGTKTYNPNCLNCQFASGTCQAITTCASISDSTVCNLNSGTDGYCYLNGSTCQAMTQCSQLTTQPQCNAAKSALGQSPACFWDNGICAPANPSSCAQIFDQTHCEGSSLNCQWNAATSQCSALPTDTCSGIIDQNDCLSTTKHAGITCQWCNGTCSLVSGGCTGVTCSESCTGACQWYSWNAITVPPANVAVPNGAPGNTGACGNKNIVNCQDIIDPNTCAASTAPQCWWPNASPSQCVPDTTRSCQNSSPCPTGGGGIVGRCNANPNCNISGQNCTTIYQCLGTPRNTCNTITEKNNAGAQGTVCTWE